MAERHPRPNPLPQTGEGAAESQLRFDSLSRMRERAGVRVQNARELRANGTDAEQTLWHHLRARQLHGHKFRRQHPLGPYIADFVCVEARLVVELDGGQHAQEQALEYDALRTQFFNNQGWRVLRFWNHEALTQTPSVLEAIAQALDHPHPHPLPPAGEGVKPKGFRS